MLRFVFTGYIEHALTQAEFDKLEDGTFSGCIPSCKGVIAFGKTLRECEEALHSTLEDWILVGLLNKTTCLSDKARSAANKSLGFGQGGVHER
jgi:predicted RNase H-like HicB family nuclease